jgi:hypothetical protein
MGASVVGFAGGGGSSIGGITGGIGRGGVETELGLAGFEGVSGGNVGGDGGEGLGTRIFWVAVRVMTWEEVSAAVAVIAAVVGNGAVGEPAGGGGALLLVGGRPGPAGGAGGTAGAEDAVGIRALPAIFIVKPAELTVTSTQGGRAGISVVCGKDPVPETAKVSLVVRVMVTVDSGLLPV